MPDVLKAQATISQAVEYQILESACLWFGVNTNAPFPKAKRGKRSRRRQRGFSPAPNENPGAAEEGEVSEGEVISMRITGESLTGFLLQDFNAIPKGKDLNSLAMISLVELLGALNEKGLEHDVELLRA